MTETSSAIPDERPRRTAKQWALVGIVKGVAVLARALGPERAGAFGARFARIFGRFAAEQSLGVDNLAAAYPEKSEAERRRILAGAWDNLARTVAELPEILKLTLKDPADPSKGLTDRIEIVGEEWLLQLRDDGQPAAAFLSHLGNWELLAPFVASYGMPLVTLYRKPHNSLIADSLAQWRGDVIDLVPSGPGAASKIAYAMRRGRHFGMLMDQRLTGGPEVPFFGRPAPTNPIVARFARQFDCPVVGVRCVRLPGTRFRIEVTKPLDLPRDDEGKIDVVPATAAMTAVIEGWVREHPEQWLWLHRRWR